MVSIDRPNKTKSVILVAATSVFAQQGFGAASISKIAGTASVSKATVFHHFESKENLYLEVLLQTFRLIANAWEKSIGSDEADINLSLKNLAHDTLDFQKHHSDSLKLLIWDVLGNKNSGEQGVGPDVFHQYFKKIVLIIETLLNTSESHNKANVNANEIAFTLLAHSIFYFIFEVSLVGMEELPFVASKEYFSDWLAKKSLINSLI